MAFLLLERVILNKNLLVFLFKYVVLQASLTYI